MKPVEKLIFNQLNVQKKINKFYIIFFFEYWVDFFCIIIIEFFKFLKNFLEIHMSIFKHVQQRRIRFYVWINISMSSFLNEAHRRPLRQSWRIEVFSGSHGSTLPKLFARSPGLAEGLETCPEANLAKSGREYFPLFFSTRPSDEYDSAPSRKYSRPLLDVFACNG